MRKALRIDLLAQQLLRIIGLDAGDVKTAQELVWRGVVVIGTAATIGASIRVFLWTSGFGG